jgi:hypothetical protein
MMHRTQHYPKGADTVRITRNGRDVTLWASADDTYRWAHRSGASWPCSTLSGNRLRVELQDGDLVGLTVNGRDGDLDGHELDAFLADMGVRA